MLGHQRGWEILHARRRRAADRVPDLPRLRARAGRETRWSSRRRPRCRRPTARWSVVTDPHYNTLRLPRDRRPSGGARPRAQDGDRVRRPLLAAAAASTSTRSASASPRRSSRRTPTRRCPGYGHYAYDHEGTPARRVVHIDRGIFTGLHEQPADRGDLRRRAQRSLEGDRRRRWSRSSACPTPSSRGRPRSGRDIMQEVDHGYYLVGHRTPSIAESRENFRISAPQGLRDPRRPSSAGSTATAASRRTAARLPDERRRRRRRLPALPDPELRQGPADADQASSATAGRRCGAARGRRELSAMRGR